MLAQEDNIGLHTLMRQGFMHGVVSKIEQLVGFKLQSLALVIIISEIFWNLGLVFMLIDRGIMFEWEWSMEVLTKYRDSFDALNFSLSGLFLLGFLMNRLGSIMIGVYLLLFINKSSTLAEPIKVFCWLDILVAISVTIAFFIPSLDKLAVLFSGIAISIFLFLIKYSFSKLSPKWRKT